MEPYTGGNVLKMLLGPTNKWYDEDNIVSSHMSSPVPNDVMEAPSSQPTMSNIGPAACEVDPPTNANTAFRYVEATSLTTIPNSHLHYSIASIRINMSKHNTCFYEKQLYTIKTLAEDPRDLSPCKCLMS